MHPQMLATKLLTLRNQVHLKPELVILYLCTLIGSQLVANFKSISHMQQERKKLG